MTASDAPGGAICAVDDLPDPGCRGFETGGVAGFLVRRNGTVRAYRDACPHTGAPLAWTPDGYLDADGELIQCSLHGALFIAETGECVHGPCLGAFLDPLSLRIMDGCIHVLVPGADPELTGA
jgi:nitrite reductase/ring-hydroxylating ferredoxin subunit